MSAFNGSTTMDEAIGRLHISPMRSVDGLVSNLSEDQRGTLATFCYVRAHLHEVALAIAATCNLDTLVHAGGKPGNFLFEQSRQRPESEYPDLGARRAKITLATNTSRQMLDEELEPAMNKAKSRPLIFKKH
jgi:hypothetical protein